MKLTKNLVSIVAHKFTILLAEFALVACLVLPACAERTAELSFPRAPEAALRHFPVLVRISSTAPAGFTYADCPTSSNLWFTDEKGDVLPFDVDTWNTAGTSLVWVSVPVFSLERVVVMHWSANGGDVPVSPGATNVWSRAGYVGVWHMNEILEDAESGKHYTPDASANGWNAYKTVESDAVPAPVTVATGVTSAQTPLTGTAMNIAYGGGKGRNDVGGFLVPAAVTSSTQLNGPGFTISAIVNSQQRTGNGRARVVAFGENLGGVNLAVGSEAIYCMGNSTYHFRANPASNTNWVYAASVFASPSSFIYADGANLSGDGDQPNIARYTLLKGIGIGAFTGGNETLDGYIDEVRIRNAASTADWLAAECAMVKDADYVSFDVPHFLALSVEGVTSTGAVVTTKIKTLGTGATSADVWFTYSDGTSTNVIALGTKNAASTISVSLENLSASTTYTCWFTATNNATSVVGANSAMKSFTTWRPPSKCLYSSKLSFPNAPADALEDFPVLVRISSAAPAGFDYADCPIPGCLWFTGEDNAPLPFDVDTWNVAGESLVWVSVPSFSSSSTITMHWAPKGAAARNILASSLVWSRAGYVGVWHMNEILEDAQSGKHYTPDASASGWNAYKTSESDYAPVPVTTATGVTAAQTPLTGTAMNIAYGEGKTRYDVGGFKVPSSATSSTTLNGPGFTISAIVNSQQIAYDARARVVAFGTGYSTANVAVGSDEIYCMGAGYQFREHSAGRTNWVYAADVFGTKSFIYVNGVNLSGDGGAPNLSSFTPTSGIGIGALTTGKETLDGYIDEARIRNAASTAAWIAAEYATVTDSGYVSFAEIETIKSGTLIIFH